MPNVLGYYNPVFYANEALIQLEKALGMAGRVFRGYELERNSFARGDTINIRRPSTFTAANAPSTAADLSPDSVQITLANWKEVKFKLNDKELAFTGKRIIDEHIRPAAVALADDIDIALSALYADIPHANNVADTAGVADITTARKTLFNNKVPLSNLHFMIDGGLEEALLVLQAFSQQQGAGDMGVSTQMRGTLGPKFGFEIFANQNVQTHTAGSMAATAGALTNGAVAKGDTVINIDDATALTGTINKGDIITVGTEKYAVTANTTASGNAAAIPVSPPARSAIADGTSVTFDQESTKTQQNLAFHRNAFAAVMAPLPDHASDIGVRVATVSDPTTGLSLRSRVYYVGDSSELHVALDVLYGVKTLDPDMAVRARNND